MIEPGKVVFIEGGITSPKRIGIVLMPEKGEINEFRYRYYWVAVTDRTAELISERDLKELNK